MNDKVKRRRNNLLIFYVDDQELELIKTKMSMIGISNRSAYLRKAALDGYILHVDHSFLKDYNRQIRMVGININQITHHMNATGNLFKEDVFHIKKMMDEIWRLQRYILLSLR